MNERRCETWHVSGEEAHTLVETLTDPPEPNEALLTAAKQYAAFLMRNEHPQKETKDGP